MDMLMVSFLTVWSVLKIVLLVIMSLCALFIILVVMFQPGNSSGISALGGQTETFLGKNKSKTFEHRMRKLTVISSIVFAVLCIVFAIVAMLANA
ncbi:MAG: preprotein translocase subunit SecG [Clostridia bacterium]|nr:preprotein translocase subunit SecG [Clostridia bacterium]